MFDENEFQYLNSFENNEDKQKFLKPASKGDLIQMKAHVFALESLLLDHLETEKVSTKEVTEQLKEKRIYFLHKLLANELASE